MHLHRSLQRQRATPTSLAGRPACARGSRKVSLWSLAADAICVFGTLEDRPPPGEGSA